MSLPTPPEPITALIDALLRSDQQSGGHPTIPPGGRKPLLEWLRLALVDRATLRAHLDLLQARPAGAAHHNQPLPDPVLDVIAQGALVSLDDDALARLALNPVALQDLFDELLAQLPPPGLGVPRNGKGPAEPGEGGAPRGEGLLEAFGLTVPMLVGDAPLPPHLKAPQPPPPLDPPRT